MPKVYKRKNVEVAVGQIVVTDLYDGLVLRKMTSEALPESQWIYCQEGESCYVTVMCGTRKELDSIHDVLSVLDELNVYYETDFDLPTKS